MNRLNVVDWIFMILLVVGGLNWGLVGLFNFNLVSAIFGVDTLLSNLVYIIVGISALYVLVVLLIKSGRPTA
jgi:uncharacterized protein